MIKVHVAFVFRLQTFKLIDLIKIFQLKGLKPKSKGHMNFYECCDLTKKVYLLCLLWNEVKKKGNWKKCVFLYFFPVENKREQANNFLL